MMSRVRNGKCTGTAGGSSGSLASRTMASGRTHRAG
jgi:hypothetical protein